MIRVDKLRVWVEKKTARAPKDLTTTSSAETRGARSESRGTPIKQEIKDDGLSRVQTELVAAQARYEDVLRVSEARLRQAEKMEALGRLAGGIAHDLNNVLCGIIGYTDMSLDLAKNNSALEENLHMVLKAADRAKHLVKQILTFSREGNTKKSATSIRPIIEAVLELLRASIPTSVIIESDLHKDTKPVLADPTKLYKMFLNLTTHAAHAMGRKGILTIRLYAEALARSAYGRNGEIVPGEYTVIEVAETGCGMDEIALSKLFEPSDMTKDGGKGTGMGLSVVLEVVQSHGGAVQVESAAGKGTTFRIYLPVTDMKPFRNHEICTLVRKVLDTQKKEMSHG